MSQQHDDRDEGLPAAEAAVMAQALEAVTPDTEAAARMKARILQGISKPGSAGTTPVASPGMALSPLTVRAEERQWKQVARGVEMCALHEDENSRSLLLRMQPDSFLLPHRHEMSEESLLLEGDAIIGEDLRLKAGDYHFSPAGSVHPLLQSPGGCIVYIRGQKGFSPRLTPGLFKRLLRSRTTRADK